MFNTIKYNISISLPFHPFMHGQCNLQNNIYNEHKDVSLRAGAVSNMITMAIIAKFPNYNNYNFKILVNSSSSQCFYY